MLASFKVTSFETVERATPPYPSGLRGRWIRWHPSLSREQYEPLLYLATLGLFETISDLWNPVLGNLLHAVLMVWLVYRGSTHVHSRTGKLLLCISVCPMIRLISFAVSPSLFPGIWYYVTTEGIVLVAGFFAVIVNGYAARDVGLRLDKRLWTVPLILLSGFVTGWIEAHVVTPPALVAGISFGESWLTSLMLIVFTGFTEEFIFRGIIQHAAGELYKPWVSIVFTALLWGFLHIGWYSWLEILFVSVIGLLWGTLRHLNRGVITLSLAHGMANIMLFVVMPYLNR